MLSVGRRGRKADCIKNHIFLSKRLCTRRKCCGRSELSPSSKKPEMTGLFQSLGPHTSEYSVKLILWVWASFLWCGSRQDIRRSLTKSGTLLTIRMLFCFNKKRKDRRNVSLRLWHQSLGSLAGSEVGFHPQRGPRIVLGLPLGTREPEREGSTWKAAAQAWDSGMCWVFKCGSLWE